MKALILAAGMASRLRPLTDHTPKCLLRIGQQCLLERTIGALQANGIDDVTIVTGYLAEQIETFVNERFPQLRCTFIRNENYASTNNIYSLWLARDVMRGSDFLLLDSDIFFAPELIAALLQSPSADCLALNCHPLGEEEIKVIADAKGKVVEISKTCRIEAAIGESIGIEKISSAYAHDLFDELDRMIVHEHLGHVFYEQAFERLIAKGRTFDIVDTTAIFSMEIDTVDDFLLAEKNYMLLKQKRSS
ncbi:phosphocholine cytidylyltransferase family protein [Tannerella sp.]|uniref:phosphocholine cytidylyltransferase family protein n=1 Tax=Tannerella sp. TaxID=2382127 RepID=UPI0026DB5C79|nr:phosphocholine cytidylyltransferase family protein [Tannerella sp.]MDO4703094.1 phosphocholine cytidylyltransferase family protein [Tannerella sp.]